MRLKLLLLGLYAGTASLVPICVAGADEGRDKLPFDPRHFSYTLIQGKGRGVCEAYLRHLKTFPPETPPMACERKFHPKYGDFALPQWRDLDPRTHRELIYKLRRFMACYGREPDCRFSDEDFDKTWQYSLQHGTAKLTVTYLDLESDGKPEPILRYQWGSCRVENTLNGGGAWAFFVLNDDLTEIDQQRTRGLVLHGQDIILHRATPFIGSWSGNLTTSPPSKRLGLLYISELSARPPSFGGAPVCTFKYRRTAKSKNK